tara:strand:+ start:462 stop:1142 length:681 start_codon:yes stop_codon:yes gene_type:complete
MNKVILSTLTLVLISITSSFANKIEDEINKVKNSLTNTALNTKHAMTPSKKAKSLIEVSLSKINSGCCEENFKYRKDVMEIKDIFEDCLESKCYKYNFPLVSNKKPPKKVLALRRINLVDDLILENENQKYQNLITKMELEQSEQDKQKKKIKLQNEKDIQLVKKQLMEKQNENEKLKNTVNKMLINYQKKIVQLKKENQTLQNNFDIVFEAHSKNYQKKLSEKLK